jgi:putative endonuclease
VEASYQVYVAQNPKGKFYIGLSENVAERLRQHNCGVSKWTRSRGPWRRVWTAQPMTLGNARRLETFLKRQKGGTGFYAYTGLARSGS